MIISIFASIGSQNLGDELILKNEIKLLENEYGEDTQFIVFSYDIKNPFFKKTNIKYVSYFPIGIKKPENILKNLFNLAKFLKIIIKSNLIVIGGGGIIYDSEIQTTKSPLDLWVFRTNIFRFFRKNIIFFAVGININDDVNLEKVKKIFYKASNISVRDRYSQNLLKDLGIKSVLIMDPVFYDNYNSFEKGLGFNNGQKNTFLKKILSNNFSYEDLLDIHIEGKTIGIAFRRGYLNYNEKKLDTRIEEGKINEIINYILNSGGKIILIPHSFHKEDTIANDYLFLLKFLNNNQNISISNSVQETYEIYKSKKIDLCLSMRLHSIILSQVYKIPFIGISYSTKTYEVLNLIESYN